MRASLNLFILNWWGDCSANLAHIYEVMSEKMNVYSPQPPPPSWLKPWRGRNWQLCNHFWSFSLSAPSVSAFSPHVWLFFSYFTLKKEDGERVVKNDRKNPNILLGLPWLLYQLCKLFALLQPVNLAALHSPALHNKSASPSPPPPPPATLQSLHHDTVTLLRKWGQSWVPV